MIKSLQQTLTQFVNKAIKVAYPLDPNATVQPMTARNEVYSYDYISESPKELYDQNKSNNLYLGVQYMGIRSYKEFTDEIKIQMPRSEFLARVEASENGHLKIKLSTPYVQSQIENYHQYISGQGKNLIILPLIPADINPEYDYFRAVNLTEKLQRIGNVYNIETDVWIPSPNSLDLQLYQSLTSNDYFNIMPQVMSVSENIHKEEEIQNFQQNWLDELMNILEKNSNDNVHNIVLESSAAREPMIRKKLKQIENMAFKSKIRQIYFGDLLLDHNNEKKVYEYDMNKPVSVFSTLKNFDLSNNGTISEVKSYYEELGLKFSQEELLKTYLSQKSTHQNQTLDIYDLENFINTDIKVILQAWIQLRLNISKEESGDLSDLPYDDLGRHLSVRLLRINDLSLNCFQSGEVNKLFEFWKNLATMWYNILAIEKYQKDYDRRIIIKHTEFLFQKLSQIFLQP